MLDEIPRDKKTQDALVNFDGYANQQNLIDAWRKRLCSKATKEARELAEDFKSELHKSHPLESNVLVPNCIYRWGCPEFTKCGCIQAFVKWCNDKGYKFEITDIQKRYDYFNEYFYSRRK